MTYCWAVAHQAVCFAALMWFKDHFVKCNDRAALVKTWLPSRQEATKSWLDQLVYDRALNLVRGEFYPCFPL